MNNQSIVFSNIASEKELRNCGIPFRTLKKMLADTIAPMSISISSYKKLYDVIEFLKTNWLPFHNGPFVSRQAEIIYCLLYVQGKHRSAFLGITDDLYENRQKAEKWYKGLAKLVHPDIQGGNKDAFSVLNALYQNMIDDGK